MRLFARPFRPEDEAEADRDGVRWAYELGYDPRELSRLFRRWHERDIDQSRMPMFFRTHPHHVDRYAAVLELYAHLQKSTPKEDLYVGRPNLRLRLTRDQTEFVE